MTVLSLRAEGTTFLEALHALLSEAERIGAGIAHGTVTIERRYNRAADDKYMATWDSFGVKHDRA